MFILKYIIHVAPKYTNIFFQLAKWFSPYGSVDVKTYGVNRALVATNSHIWWVYASMKYSSVQLLKTQSNPQTMNNCVYIVDIKHAIKLLHKEQCTHMRFK